jgi:hypothetical protein
VSKFGDFFGEAEGMDSFSETTSPLVPEGSVAEVGVMDVIPIEESPSSPLRGSVHEAEGLDLRRRTPESRANPGESPVVDGDLGTV